MDDPIHPRIEDKSETLPRLDPGEVAEALGAEDAGPAPQHPWPVGSGGHKWHRENVKRHLATSPKCEMSHYIDAYSWTLFIPFRDGLSGAGDICEVIVKSTHCMGLEDGSAYEDAKLWVDNNLSVNEAQRDALHKAIDEAEIDHVDHEAEAAGLEWKLRGMRRNAQGKLISAAIDPRDMEELLRSDAVDAAKKWLRGSTADRRQFTTQREGLLLALYVEAASKAMENKDV